MTPPRSIDSAEALYRKLERTFDRRTTYGEDQLDWVFDVAVTACRGNLACPSRSLLI
jgi:RNAse (barnase) inhibitor barstar